MPSSTDAAITRLEIHQDLPTQDSENPGGFVHVPALDGIRGAAILLVLFDHLFWSNTVTGNRIFDILSAIRASSYVGVNLFFALSGFLITGILLDTLSIPHFFRTFYARRVLRIFPLYYGVLVLLLLLTRPLHLVWNGWQYFFLTYTSNLALWTRPPLELAHVNIDHFWSLQVEEQFYFVWPFIVFRVRKLQSLIRLSLITCLAVLLLRVGIVAARPFLQNPYLPYSPTFSCVDNLLFGCCLCALLRTSLRSQVLRLAPRVFAVCIAVLGIAALQNGGLDWTTSIFIPTVGFSLVGVTSAALIAMTLRNGSTAQQIFQGAFLRFFGKYSYGIYVFHYTVSKIVNIPLRIFLNQRFHSKGLGVIAAALVCLVLTVILALLSYYLYEVHFLKLKRFFSYSNKGKSVDKASLVSR
jgi:peptidoglycan/LPS O-acetylase OafA/YrhL